MIIEAVRDLSLGFAKVIAIKYWNTYKLYYERSGLSRQDVIHTAYVEVLELLDKVKNKKLTEKELRGYISLKIGKSKLNRLRKQCEKIPTIIPFDKISNQDDELNPHEYMVDDRTSHNKLYLQIYSSLDEPNKGIFEDYFKHNLNYGEIAKKNKISRDKARRTIKNIVDLVRKNNVAFRLTK